MSTEGLRTHVYNMTIRQVADTTSMLALTDIIVGQQAQLVNKTVYQYTGDDPSNIASWKDITSAAVGGNVDSVNGKAGVVVLSKADIGLPDVDNTSDAAKPVSTATQTALGNKVDKVVGKTLSTNDFTDSLKTKLDGVESGAEQNTVDSVNTKVGAVVLAKADVGLPDVDNTSDATKAVAGNPVGDAIIAAKLKIISDAITYVVYEVIGSLAIKTFTSDVELVLTRNNTINFTDKLVAGDLVAIKNNGDYRITITPDVGVTVDAVDNDLTLYDKYEVRVLVYEGNDHWTLI